MNKLITIGIIYDKSHIKDRYKYDFINYHRKDLDWLAFVTILCTVNVALVIMDHTVLREKYANKVGGELRIDGPLQSLMYQLLANHML